MKKYYLLVAAAFLCTLMPHAVSAAAANLWIYCGGLPSCGAGFTEHFTPALIALLLVLPYYVYILAALFIMIGGVYMIVSLGDAEKVTKGKNTIIWALIGIFVMQFAETAIRLVIMPEVVTRFDTPDLVASLTITIMNDIFILLYIVLVIIAIISGMRMVLAMGKEDEFKKGKDGLFWAAVGGIVINLAQGLASAFCLVNTSVCYIS